MKRITLILGIVVSLLLIACTDQIVVDIPDTDRRLVVDAWLRTDTSLNVVKLSRSANFSDDSINFPEKGAIVYVESVGGTRFDFNEEADGSYERTGNDWLKDDTSYVLVVETTAGGKYRSKPQKVIPVPIIDSLRFLSSDYIKSLGLPFDAGEEGLYPAITAIERPGKGDFYAWKVFINGKDESIGNNQFTADDEGLVDGAAIPFELAWFLDSVGIGDTVSVEQLTLNEESYRYILALQQQFNGGGPFSTPPAPVEGNLFREDEDEFVLGVFIISGSDKITEIVRTELITDI